MNARVASVSVLSVMTMLLSACGPVGGHDDVFGEGTGDSEQAASNIRTVFAPSSSVLDPARDRLGPGEDDPLTGVSSDDYFCPSGFWYDNALRLCVDDDEAVGPFPEAMRRACTDNGGGSPCDDAIWSRAFAGSLRGDGRCPRGAKMTAKGICVEGDEAFGPFPKAQVEACKDMGGGPACEGLRWSAWLAENTVPKSTTLAGLRVAIDAGHGMASDYGTVFDPGACSTGGSIREYDLNFATAKALEEALKDHGATVSLFVYPPGSAARTLVQKGARAAGHHVFVSLHHNSGGAQGSEVLVHHQHGGSDEVLAAATQRRLVSLLWDDDAGRNRGVKSANLGVLRGVPSSVEAAVLSESFFVDAPGMTQGEAQLLCQSAARAVAEGIATYWQSR